jgi:hypothetical protein
MDRWEEHPVAAWFFYGHLWLALGAMAQRWWMGSFGFTVEPRGLLATGLAVVAAYGYLRLVRASEPDPIPSDHILWFRKHSGVWKVLVVVTAVSALGLGWGHQLVFGPWSLLVPVAVLFYLVPWRNSAGRSMGLRQVPGIKVLLVALGWTFITCGVSSEEVPPFERSVLVWHALMQLCLFAAMAMTFDVGDLHYDPPGLRTVPQMVGVRATKATAIILLLPWATFLTILGLAQDADPRYLLSLVGLLFLAALILITRPQRPWWFFGVVLDGALILLPVLCLLGGLFS